MNEQPRQCDGAEGIIGIERQLGVEGTVGIEETVGVERDAGVQGHAGGRQEQGHVDDQVAVLQAEADRTREIMADCPRIYVASLSDYNAGILHGEWMEADKGLEALASRVGEMLARSPTAREYGEPAEEYAIHDYEGFGVVRLGEYERLETVVELAEGISEHGPAFAAWWAEIRPMGDETSGSNWFEDSYQGSYASLEEFGWSLLDGVGVGSVEDLGQMEGVNLPEFIRPYVSIDVGSWTRDLMASGQFDWVEHEDGVWVFEIQ